MLVRNIDDIIKDRQAIFLMTIGNNMIIGIINFNRRSSVLGKKANMILIVDKVED